MSIRRRAVRDGATISANCPRGAPRELAKRGEEFGLDEGLSLA